MSRTYATREEHDAARAAAVESLRQANSDLLTFAATSWDYAEGVLDENAQLRRRLDTVVESNRILAVEASKDGHIDRELQYALDAARAKAENQLLKKALADLIERARAALEEKETRG